MRIAPKRCLKRAGRHDWVVNVIVWLVVASFWTAREH